MWGRTRMDHLRVENILVVGTAALCLHTCCFTFWRTAVFQILNLNHIRFRGSGKLHSQRSENLFFNTSETQWKTIVPSQKGFKRSPLLLLWITSVEGYNISNDSFDVFQEYLSQATKGFVYLSIVSSHTFYGFLRSFVGFEQYFTIPEEIGSMSNWRNLTFSFQLSIEPLFLTENKMSDDISSTLFLLDTCTNHAIV